MTGQGQEQGQVADRLRTALGAADAAFVALEQVLAEASDRRVEAFRTLVALEAPLAGLASCGERVRALLDVAVFDDGLRAVYDERAARLEAPGTSLALLRERRGRWHAREAEIAAREAEHRTLTAELAEYERRAALTAELPELRRTVERLRDAAEAATAAGAVLETDGRHLTRPVRAALADPRPALEPAGSPDAPPTPEGRPSHADPRPEATAPAAHAAHPTVDPATARNVPPVAADHAPTPNSPTIEGPPAEDTSPPAGTSGESTAETHAETHVSGPASDGPPDEDTRRPAGTSAGTTAGTTADRPPAEDVLPAADGDHPAAADTRTGASSATSAETAAVRDAAVPAADRPPAGDGPAASGPGAAGAPIASRPTATDRPSATIATDRPSVTGGGRSATGSASATAAAPAVRPAVGGRVDELDRAERVLEEALQDWAAPAAGLLAALSPAVADVFRRAQELQQRLMRERAGLQDADARIEELEERLTQAAERLRVAEQSTEADRRALKLYARASLAVAVALGAATPEPDITDVRAALEHHGAALARIDDALRRHHAARTERTVFRRLGHSPAEGEADGAPRSDLEAR